MSFYEDNDDIKYIIHKCSNQNINFNEVYKNEIDLTLISEGSEASVSLLTKCLFYDFIFYDNKDNCWFYYNHNNILKKSKKHIIYISLVKTILVKLYNNINCQNIITKIQNPKFISNLIKIAICDFNKN
jgi:hypothetical protein